jgi:hypothetical protein
MSVPHSFAQLVAIAAVGIAVLCAPSTGSAQCSERCEMIVKTLPDKGPLEIDDQVSHLWLKFEFDGRRYLAIQNNIDIKADGVDIYRYEMGDDGPNILLKGLEKERLKLTDKEKVNLISNSCVSEEIVGRLNWMRAHIHPPATPRSAEEAQAWNRRVDEERSRPGPCSVLSSPSSTTAEQQMADSPKSDKPWQKKIAVAATRPWTPTGIQVQIGDDVSISATGVIQANFNGAKATPAGTSPDCMAAGVVRVPFVAPELPCWSLLGRIGPSGNVFEVGTNRRFKANAIGQLYLGVNDNFFADNSGHWTAGVAVSKSPLKIHSTKGRWFGFANDTSPQDREVELRQNCGDFKRTDVPDEVGSKYTDLCRSVGGTCERVCDWQGTSFPCDAVSLGGARDGTRVALCR